MKDNDVFSFKGEETTVTWDQRLCIHASECVRANSPLFEYGRKPWGKPDLVDPAEVDDIVRRCPSGALAYTEDGKNPETPPPENSATVIYNGPLYVSGDLKIDGAPDDMPGVQFRAALCRCGASNQKPFCDNQHLETDFEDPGAVGQRGPGAEDLSGELRIRPAKDGPLLLQGNFKIVAGSGQVRYKGTKAALCRCGQSDNKPFCDGSHKDAGFEAEGV